MLSSLTLKLSSTPLVFNVLKSISSSSSSSKLNCVALFKEFKSISSSSSSSSMSKLNCTCSLSSSLKYDIGFIISSLLKFPTLSLLFNTYFYLFDFSVRLQNYIFFQMCIKFIAICLIMRINKNYIVLSAYFIKD